MADLYDRLYGTAGAIPGLERTSPAFRTKVDQVANRLKMDPQHLLAVMSFETGGTFDPAVRNRAGSGATGLIQFMPKTARSLGTTTDALARMRPEEQLDYVEHYLRPYAGRMHTPQDAYMAVLYPQAVGKPPEHVLFQQGTRAYEQNKGLDQGQTGRVTIGDTMRTVGRFVRGMATPASAEAAPVSPARSATPGDRGEALYQRLYGTTPAAQAPAPEPAAPVPSATMYQRLYGTQPQGPVPAPTPAAGPSAPPQTFQGDWRSQITAQQQAMGTQEAGRLQAERAAGSPAMPAPTLSEIGKGLAGPAISVAGGLGGAALGTAVGGPIGTAVGEAAGSYGARRLNVALGLEEPGMVGDIASVAVPPALRGVGKVLPAVTKAVVKRLPGAATALHQDVAERLTGMADRLLPAIPAEQHYAAVALQNPLITPTALAREATDIVKAEMALQPGVRNPRLLRVARDLQELTRQDVPMQTLYAHQQRVGELVRKFRSEGGVGEGRIKQLYGAFHDDLEAAAAKGVEGAQTLKDAIAASRKEHMAEEFSEMFQPGKSGITIDPEGRASLNGGRLSTAWKTKLRRDKVFRDTLSAQDKAEVEEIILTAQRLERLSTPRGGQRGSGRAAVGAAIGSAIGGPAGAAFAVYAPEIIGKAMQTPTGRAMVKKALQDGGGALDTTAINALAALVRSQLAEPEPPSGL